jgi:hypothetical protein
LMEISNRWWTSCSGENNSTKSSLSFMLISSFDRLRRLCILERWHDTLSGTTASASWLIHLTCPRPHSPICICWQNSNFSWPDDAVEIDGNFSTRLWNVWIEFTPVNYKIGLITGHIDTLSHDKSFWHNSTACSLISIRTCMAFSIWCEKMARNEVKRRTANGKWT